MKEILEELVKQMKVTNELLSLSLAKDFYCNELGESMCFFNERFKHIKQCQEKIIDGLIKEE